MRLNDPCVRIRTFSAISVYHVSLAWELYAEFFLDFLQVWAHFSSPERGVRLLICVRRMYYQQGADENFIRITRSWEKDFYKNVIL